MAGTITIETGELYDRIVAAFVALKGYSNQIPDPTWVPGSTSSPVPPLINNPESQDDFVIRLTYDFLVSTMASHEISQTVAMASAAKSTAIKVDIANSSVTAGKITATPKPLEPIKG